MFEIDFNELIDACKWLTDAGFSDAVAGALSKSENTYPDIQQRLDMTRKDQTNSGLEELQECEQSAIQRRLQVLSNASAFFNVDFNYFKEVSAYLKIFHLLVNKKIKKKRR